MTRHPGDEARRRLRDKITDELRASGWYPAERYACGCHPEALCSEHAVIRAYEHYHPGGAA